MIMPEKMSLSDFVSRRLHPVKVTIELLKHESSTAGEKATISKPMLSSVVSTLELFVEDYERLIAGQGSRSASERRMVGEESKV
jgi:hypothetical protein